MKCFYQLPLTWWKTYYAWSHTKNVASYIRNVKGGTMQFSVICFYTIFKILLTFLNNSWQRKNKSPVRYIRSSHSWTTHFQWQSRVIYSHTLCTWDHNSTYGVTCIHWKINDFLHIISKGSCRIFPLITLQYLKPKCDNVKISEGKFLSRLLTISQSTSEEV